jgi:hypothetical protein
LLIEVRAPHTLDLFQLSVPISCLVCRIFAQRRALLFDHPLYADSQALGIFEQG